MGLRLSEKEAIALGLLKTPDVNKSPPPAAKRLASAKFANAQTGDGTPQGMLTKACKKRFPQAVSEFENAIPGRKFRLDIAFPKERLAIEIDGWAFHGKFLEDFVKDREKQNLLTLNGWRILRFTARDVYKQMDKVIDHIQQALLITSQMVPHE